MNIGILILLTTLISVISALHPDNGYGKIVGGVEAPKRKNHKVQIFWEEHNNLKNIIILF